MELGIGLVLLAVAAAILWLGRPKDDWWLREKVRRVKAEGVLAILATGFLGMGLAMLISGAVSAFS